MANQTWIPIHREAAAKLLEFQDRQNELIELLRKMEEDGLTVISLEYLFMSEEDFDRMLALLQRKKNIVLQGLPGVGKTFVARRLAYTLMSRNDEQRAPVVQFH